MAKLNLCFKTKCSIYYTAKSLRTNTVWNNMQFFYLEPNSGMKIALSNYTQSFERWPSMSLKLMLDSKNSYCFTGEKSNQITVVSVTVVWIQNITLCLKLLEMAKEFTEHFLLNLHYSVNNTTI